MTTRPIFSDYIIYADESGDLSYETINPRFPVFCLTLCVIKKQDYIQAIVPAIQQVKFDFWGHDRVILHEREMRKQEGQFGILRTSASLRDSFFYRINEVLKNTSFKLISAVIKKEALLKKYSSPADPYHLALGFCLERVHRFLIDAGEAGKEVSLIFESRGKQEDAQLELEFRRIISKDKPFGYRLHSYQDIDFKLHFATKQHNSTGLQLADLTARPIALGVINPTQPNRAYDIIKEKFNTADDNKIFPE